MLLYKHCRDLKNVIYGEVKAHPGYSEPDFKDAYSWLEKEVGFYPLFLAVGSTEEDIRMTGYQNQWGKVVGSEIVGRLNDGTYIQRNILRKRGEFPNYVLFSFRDIDGIFMDYDYWHFVLNAGYKNYKMTDYEKRLIFKPSWSKAKWLRKTRKEHHSVQLVTKTLYLPNAERIWVRNQQTKGFLESMGFENVEVRRLFFE